MENTQTTNKKIGLNSLISWGASVVIIGLTFKLLHWDGGEWMIAIGLLVESCLFFLLGFASLNDPNGTSLTNPAPGRDKDAKGMDDVLSTSIGPDVIDRLKRGFDQFNKTVESVNSITGSAQSTEGMVKEIEMATREIHELRKNLAELNNAYRAQLDAFRKS